MIGMIRTSFARSSRHTTMALISVTEMRIANITSLTSRGEMVMGDFGYIYGYMLVFVFCLGALLGYIIGRWMDK